MKDMVRREGVADRFEIASAIGEDDQNKVSLLLEHAGINRDVADPWYTGNFQATWDDVNVGCKALLDEILGDRPRRA